MREKSLESKVQSPNSIEHSTELITVNSKTIFMQEQNRDRQNKSSEETKISLTPDSTLQTPEEDQHDKSIDPRKDNSIAVSNDDLHETDADRYAGSDRAGTSERKDNRMEPEDREEDPNGE